MIDLTERIKRGKEAIAQAKAQSKDVTSWEQHLAGLVTERAYALADEVNDALNIKDGMIREANRLGWAFLDLVRAGLPELYWKPLRERELALLGEIGQHESYVKEASQWGRLDGCAQSPIQSLEVKDSENPMPQLRSIRSG